MLNIVRSETFQTAVDLQNTLKNIPNTVHPRHNQFDNVSVEMSIILSSIQDYDEVTGKLVVATTFLLVWNDQIRQWNISDYGDTTESKVPVANSWLPKLYIRNLVGTKTVYLFDNGLDMASSFVYYNYTGGASYVAKGLYEFSCSADASYFPYDIHDCVIKLNGIDSNIHLHVGDSIQEHLIPNSEWFVENLWGQNQTSAHVSVISFYLTLKRSGLFLTINIVVPVILLSFVNLLVFCIPVESGERASLAVTLLLSFVVFMPTVVVMLPSTEKISYFNIFVLIQLLCSVLMTVCAVWSISVYHKCTENCTQGLLTKIVLFIGYKLRRCRRCNRTVGTEMNEKTVKVTNTNPDDNVLNNSPKNDSEWSTRNTREWNTEANIKYSFVAFDDICFKIFSVILIMNLLTCGIIIAFRK